MIPRRARPWTAWRSASPWFAALALCCFAGTSARAAAELGVPGIAIPRTLWSGGAPPSLNVEDYTIFPRDTMHTNVQRVWRSRIVQPGVESADLLAGDSSLWLAQTCCAELPDSLRRVTFSCGQVNCNADLSQVAGMHPSLARTSSGRFLFAAQGRQPGAGGRIRVWLAGQAHQWQDGPWLVPPPGVAGEAHAVASRFVADGKNGWLLPVCYGSSPATVVVHRTSNGDAWETIASLQADGESGAALAIAPGGSWVLMTTQRGRFLRRVSADRGRTWSGPDTLAFRTVDAGAEQGSGFALRTGGSPAQLWLAFPGPAADTTAALPALQPLYLAASSDAGRTWGAAAPAMVRPGRVAVQPALSFQRDRVRVLAIETAAGDSAGAPPLRAGRAVLAEWNPKALFTPLVWPAPHAKHGYALHAGAVHGVLRLLTAQTLARPPAQRRLFVEAYLARGLAAATPLLEQDTEFSSWQDPRLGLEHALAFADRLVLLQDPSGYWPLGYGAIFVADIAAAAGTFAALEPYADSARVRRWEGAALRFARAIESDGMILPSGAFGVGWPNSFVRFGPRADRSPYLVSTALAGIEMHAWLWNRTHDPKLRERALRAFDYTLSQLQPDGSLPAHKTGEGALTAAAYVEEGWMMLDLLWRDAEILARLKAVLPAHVQWLLRTQRPDGTWDGGAEGEFARTPAIVNFLIWYDQRCNSTPDVRLAVQRASRALSDPGQWPKTGLFHAGNHHEVQRAHALRALAAIAGGKPVP